MKTMLAGLVASLAMAASARSQEPDPLTARQRMVAEQIERRGVKSPVVLAAMRKVPRHVFMPADAREYAYDDRAISIGHGQTISQPYVVAFMTESLALKPTDRVLEIGTGSGYQAAILAELVKEVHTIEIVEALGKRASETFAAEGYKNINARIGDGYRGWQEAAPFNAIIVTCSPEAVPPPLIEQLAEGGRMIIPVGPEGHPQQLVLLRKADGKIEQKEILPVVFVPMTGEAEKQ